MLEWRDHIMKENFLPSPRTFPPIVVGSVCDWETWLDCTNPTRILPCQAVELRVDALADSVRAEDILAYRCEKPLLITIRHADEGGRRIMAEDARRALMLQLLSGANAIDWEIRHLEGAEDIINTAHNLGVYMIASYHDFNKTPSLEHLLEREAYARSKGADMVKFAFHLESAEDVLIGIELLRRSSGAVAVMGMGPLGPASRMVYSQMGSGLIYGYLGETPTAPGQWPTKLCCEVLDQLLPLA